VAGWAVQSLLETLQREAQPQEAQQQEAQQQEAQQQEAPARARRKPIKAGLKKTVVRRAAKPGKTPA